MSLLLPATLDLVSIRYLEPSDWTSYISLERDPEAKRFVGGASPKTDKQHDDVLNGYQPNTGLLAIADRTTNAYIGRCGLLRDNKTSESEIYLMLSTPYLRRGIGRQVIPLLVRIAKEECRTPIGIVDPNNAASLSLLNSLGFRPSGTVDADNYQDGHIRFLLTGAVVGQQ